jgi:hypothetical protein
MLSFLRNGFHRWMHSKECPAGLGFRIAPDVKASAHAGGIVLINLNRGIVFSANRVGAAIWNGAAQRWSLDRVVDSISGEFAIPAQTAHEDAAEFLAQLAAEGLLIPDVN